MATKRRATGEPEQTKKGDVSSINKPSGLWSQVIAAFSFLLFPWLGIVRGVLGMRREGDFEKMLQYLSKEEVSVLSRMNRRSAAWSKLARFTIIYSVLIEACVVGFALLSTRRHDLSWESRALLVLPVFLFPAVAFLFYSGCAGWHRMRERSDSQILKKLRAERQAKIDELKEKTNYYATQQLIQKYDPDPAIQAAAASILVSKLGLESGLTTQVSMKENGAESTPSKRMKGSRKLDNSAGKKGLRQRKGRRSNQGSTNSLVDLKADESNAGDLDAGTSEVQGQEILPHHSYEQWNGGSAGRQNSSESGGGWIGRIAAMLVGEDPSQCYALICERCHMHNGLARKEDFPHMTYYCPRCNHLNKAKLAGHTTLQPESMRITGNATPEIAQPEEGQLLLNAPETPQH